MTENQSSEKGIHVNDIHPLHATLNQIAIVDQTAWNDFSRSIIEKELQKKDCILEAGKKCQFLVFLKSGLVRSYSENGETEITFHFYEANSLFYDDYSFITQKASKKTYEVLEKSEIILIPRSHLLNMFDKHKCFERIGRMAIEQAHIQMIEENENLSLNNAEQNYKALLQHRPHLIQKLSQKMIASYLRITTEHLSRIRNKVFNNL